MAQGQTTLRASAGKRAVLVLIGFVIAVVGLMLGCTVALQVPNFTIATYQGADELGGEQVTVKQLLAEGKPVVLNFWAGLCPPCRAEMPDFQQVYDQRRQEITVVGVDVGPFLYLGTREEGKTLLKELGVTYPAGTTFDEEAVRSMELLGMPTTLFLTPDGNVQRNWTGLLTKAKLNELIDELLEQS